MGKAKQYLIKKYLNKPQKATSSTLKPWCGSWKNWVTFVTTEKNYPLKSTRYLVDHQKKTSVWRALLKSYKEFF